MEQSQNQRNLRLEMPATMTAVYSNAVVVSQTHSEIVLDFLQVMPNDARARVMSRVVLTPTNAKAFLKALSTNLERYEQLHGEITLPVQQSSLADRLFGSIKHTDEEEPGE